MNYKFDIEKIIGFIKRNFEQLVCVFCSHNADLCIIPVDIEDHY